MSPITRLARTLLPALALTAGCAALAPDRAAAQDPPGTEPAPETAQHASVCLILSAPDAAPGSTVDLGVSFTIEPGWHLYWNGRNDTGVAPKIHLVLPGGITAGATLWPAPARQVMGGDILDHIYENQMTLVVPLTIGKDAAPGSVKSIRASCTWLVCKNVCLFESGDAEVELRVGPASDLPQHNKGRTILEAARAKVPKVLEPGSTLVETEVKPGGEGGESVFAEVRVKGATTLEFYPDLECAEFADPIADTSAEAEVLHIRFAVSQVDSQKALTGVLAVWKPGETDPAYYSLSVGRAR